MKKHLLSTIIPAVALMAFNVNAGSASLDNAGALTINWSITQQKDALAETHSSHSAVGKKSTNYVYNYKASSDTSTFSSADLLNLLSNSFPGTIVKGDKLATDGEYIYVVDKTGSNIVENVSSVLTVEYSTNTIISGAATVTTNDAESTPVVTIVTNPVVTISGSNVTPATNIVIVASTNITTTTTLTKIGTNILTTLTGGTTNYTTNYDYSTNYTYMTNLSPETNIVTTGTNIVTTTNIDMNVIGTNSVTTTNFIYMTNYTYTTNTPAETNMVAFTNYTYATNFTYTTNTVDTTAKTSGMSAYTISSYFTLKYDDTNTATVFRFVGVSSTVNDVNLAKDTGTENFTVKSGSGAGTIDGKYTLITGTITGAAKGAATPPPE